MLWLFFFFFFFQAEDGIRDADVTGVQTCALPIYGEVCVTAVEMQAQVTLRFGLERGRHLPEPQLRTSRRLASGTNTGPWFATTAHGPDLFASSQRAVLHMIDHLVRERGFSREEAYVICSVAADLKISEIVDAPNWIVSAFIPESIFP